MSHVQSPGVERLGSLPDGAAPHTGFREAVAGQPARTQGANALSVVLGLLCPNSILATATGKDMLILPRGPKSKLLTTREGNKKGDWGAFNSFQLKSSCKPQSQTQEGTRG